ncbi:VanZ family protein [Brevibacterium sp. JNUCC-42]|nr:VanZ family protein [Brevibacterium sp. JNUCC-42]
MIKKNTILYNTIFFFLPLYLVFVIYIFLLHSVRLHSPYYGVNLIPFDTISTFLMNYDHYNSDILVKNLLGNIIIYIPMGIFMPLLFTTMNSMKKVVVFTVIFSLVINILQVTTKIGVFDIDDIMLNVVGGVIGYVLFRGWFSLIAILFHSSSEDIQ